MNIHDENTVKHLITLPSEGSRDDLHHIAHMNIALRNGQVEKIAHPHHGLFSEDLW